MAPVRRIVFADIQAYLDAIADNPDDAGDIDSSRHGRFWQVAHKDFISGTVPGENCAGTAIPIVDKDAARCPFYQALTNPSGWCNKGQMPKNGPARAFITSANYKVKLKDGSTVTGREIDDNVVWWLTNGMPDT
jgi:hypothetical protein